MKRTQLSHNSTFKPRLTPMRRASLSRSREGGTKGPLGAGECFSCGQWAALDRSHILPQGMNKLLKTNPLNIVEECRKCHCLWGEKLADYASAYPVALAEKVRRMELLDRERWALWMMKNGFLLPGG